MTTHLPDRPSLSSLKYQAKQFVKRHHAGDTGVCKSLRNLPGRANSSDAEILGADLVLAEAQHALALTYGFPSWLALRDHVTASEAGAAGGFNLSDSQRDEFRRRGVIKVSGLISDGLILPVRRLIYDALEEAEVCREGQWTLERLVRTDSSRLQTRLLKMLKHQAKHSLAFADICTDEIHNVAEQLMDGRSLTTMVGRPQLLFTAPNAQRWELPHKVWHMDIPRLGEIGCPGVQMFTFIDQVDAGGAGTVVAAGSHHYINGQGRVKSKHVKKQLRGSNPWFKGLLRPDGSDRRRYLDEPTRDGDVELQVVELTGEPGDVWLMDLRVLHSLAPNAGNRPRLMATQRYFLAELGRAAFVDE